MIVNKYKGIIFLLLGFLQMSASISAAESQKDFVGERITYSIKQLGIKAGTATLSYGGLVQKEGQNYILINFHADGMNFLDDEKIYADPFSLAPRIVERDLNIFGNKENIVEHYDPTLGQVKVIKQANGKTTEIVLKKAGQLDNIYCFIYRCRRDEKFETGKSVSINLPTMDLNIKFGEKVKLTAAGKKYPAIFLHSEPSKYKIWFDTGSQKIPLRIDGAVGVGSTSMLMTAYQENNVALTINK